jgi:hypothetical protein
MPGYWDEFNEKAIHNAKIADELYGGIENTIVGSITGKSSLIGNKFYIRVLEYHLEGHNTIEWKGCLIATETEAEIKDIYQKIIPFGGWRAAVDRKTFKVLDFWQIIRKPKLFFWE